MEKDALQRVEDVLAMAIGREQRAHDFYKSALERVSNPGTKKLLQELAGEELKHRQLLEKALEEGDIGKIGGGAPGYDLGLTKLLVIQGIDQASTPQDVMIYAMKNEENAQKLYLEYAAVYQGFPLEALFRRLAQEEQRHRARLEGEYEKVFLQQM